MNMFKLDQKLEREVSSAVRDMADVLAEIAPTLQVLEGLLKEHQGALSTPSIDRFREDLQRMIPEAVHAAHLISTNSQLLIGASTQATKQLLNVESQTEASLVGSIAEHRETPRRIEGVTNTGTSFEARTHKRFQRQTNLV